MKYCIHILLLILVGITCHAQEENKASHKYFGAKAGLTLAHPNFEKGSPPSDLPTTWGSGFVGGISLSVPLSEKFSVQPEYLFRQMNSEITDTKTKIKFNYLSLPVFIKYQLSNKFSICAGPQFDLLIKGTTQNPEHSEDITHDTEERSIAASLGIAYLFWKSAAFELQYIQGLNHIGMHQRDAASEFKFESIQVSVAVQF